MPALHLHPQQRGHEPHKHQFKVPPSGHCPLGLRLCCFRGRKSCSAIRTSRVHRNWSVVSMSLFKTQSCSEMRQWSLAIPWVAPIAQQCYQGWGKPLLTVCTGAKSRAHLSLSNSLCMLTQRLVANSLDLNKPHGEHYPCVTGCSVCTPRKWISVPNNLQPNARNG